MLIGTHRVLSRDVIPKELGLVDPRRGAALRRRAEGAAEVAPARGRRADAERDADPADAAHVARRHARHLDHRDAARGPPPDPHDRRRVRRGARQAWRSSASWSATARRSTCTTASRRSRRRREKLQQLVPPTALARRARTDAREGARGQDARVPARRRRRARLDDDHRVGPRHPAGEHADRRARGHARPLAALPDPRPRRPLRRRPRTRTSSIRTRAS